MVDFNSVNHLHIQPSNQRVDANFVDLVNKAISQIESSIRNRLAHWPTRKFLKMQSHLRKNYLSILARIYFYLTIIKTNTTNLEKINKFSRADQNFWWRCLNPVGDILHRSLPETRSWSPGSKESPLHHNSSPLKWSVKYLSVVTVLASQASYLLIKSVISDIRDFGVHRSLSCWGLQCWDFWGYWSWGLWDLQCCNLGSLQYWDLWENWSESLYCCRCWYLEVRVWTDLWGIWSESLYCCQYWYLWALVLRGFWTVRNWVSEVPRYWGHPVLGVSSGCLCDRSLLLSSPSPWLTSEKHNATVWMWFPAAARDRDLPGRETFKVETFSKVLCWRGDRDHDLQWNAASCSDRRCQCERVAVSVSSTVLTSPLGAVYCQDPAWAIPILLWMPPCSLRVIPLPVLKLTNTTSQSKWAVWQQGWNVLLEHEGMRLVLIHLCSLRQYWYLMSPECLPSIWNFFIADWLVL